MKQNVDKLYLTYLLSRVVYEIEQIENPTNEPTEQIITGGTFKDD